MSSSAERRARRAHRRAIAHAGDGKAPCAGAILVEAG